MNEAIKMLREAWELERQASELREAALASLPEPLQSRMRRTVDVYGIRSDVLADAIEATSNLAKR